VPANTASFAIIVHDPDTAPDKSTSDVLHWLIFNIPGTARSLPEGLPMTEKLPDGTIQGKNFGKLVGYRGMGARAPGPYHHYTFELFALDTKLELSASASREEVLKAMDGHVLAKAADIGRFHR
jgi:Raf kinase inhibitor-like YbhB/YbcL family protein